MSRIGKNPVPVPEGVTVEVNGQDVKAKGPKGELSMSVHNSVSVVLQDNEAGNKEVKLEPKGDGKQARQLWPTMRSLVNNVVVGVSTGYEKRLEIKGVGYRANLQGRTLVLQLGFSHDVHFPIPEGIDINVDKQTSVSITGIDKQKVGQVAANIVSYRPPEPYKGKGVRYEGQHVIRKEGKKK
jgi:large subunit ribosomal protein L6